MNRQQLTITYNNGDTDELSLSLFDSMQAERHLHAKGLGTIQESPITFMSFAAYVHLRSENRTNGADFETWCSKVANIETETVEENPLD